MAEFVLKSNFFAFSSKIKQQVLGTVIGTKFAPCLFIDKSETSFLETQKLQFLVLLRYMNDIFYMDAWGGRTSHFFEMS